jgi:hypothetical protein
MPLSQLLLLLLNQEGFNLLEQSCPSVVIEEVRGLVSPWLLRRSSLWLNL